MQPGAGKWITHLVSMTTECSFQRCVSDHSGSSSDPRAQTRMMKNGLLMGLSATRKQLNTPTDARNDTQNQTDPEMINCHLISQSQMRYVLSLVSSGSDPGSPPCQSSKPPGLARLSSDLLSLALSPDALQRKLISDACSSDLVLSSLLSAPDHS